MTFVVVSGVNDSYNLNKRLVVMIPSEDFLGDIRTAASTSLGAAAGAVVGLLLLSVIAVHFVIRPLQRLETKLYASVTLEEDDEDSANNKSMFTEILRIEEAYDKLQAELKKVKSFLPQSVLKQLAQQDGDEDEDNEEAEEGGIEELSHSRGTSSANAPTLHRRSVAVASSNGRASHRTHESRYSHNTMHSRTSEERRQAIERGRTLNTSTGLTSRMTCHHYWNMDGLHLHLKSPHELAGLHTRVMGVIASQVDECKGVLDAFHGDRFTLTFNSSTNCASHCTKAAQFVLQVTAALNQQAQAHQLLHLGASGDFGSVAKSTATVAGPGIRFGVATGKALCGNLGTDKIKRFCTLGPVLNHAQVLVDMCRVYGVTNL
ncbi:mitogen-activated protein kinase, putative, partial [Bodo saltans]